MNTENNVMINRPGTPKFLLLHDFYSNKPVVVNIEFIKYIETSHRTIIQFIDKTELNCKESVSKILNKIQQIYNDAKPRNYEQCHTKGGDSISE